MTRRERKITRKKKMRKSVIMILIVCTAIALMLTGFAAPASSAVDPHIAIWNAIHALQSKVITLQGTLQGQIAGLKGQIAGLQGHIAGLQGQMTALGARISIIEGNHQPGVHVPSGTIAMWSGAIDDIPSGWALCDGNNGTPDLTDKFIVGAGNTYALGDDGGDVEHSHGAGGYEAADHTHGPGTYQVLDHAHKVDATNTGWGHVSTGTASGKLATCDPLGGWGMGAASNLDTLGSGLVGLDPAGTSDSSGALAVTGDSDSASSLPPFYALAYIMKL